MTCGRDLFAAALALVGTPFRLHGREPGVALDCVGVLEAALAGAGRPARLPNGYALRAASLPALGGLAAELGLGPVDEAAACPVPGDVLLLRPSPCQFHLAIAGGAGKAVHAHAGLRKVIFGPLSGAWQRAGHWRLLPQPRN